MAVLPPNEAGLTQALTNLRNGGLVAIPTETVYGLAANACDGEAVAAVYACKERPQFNPLICHVADFEMAQQLGRFNAAAAQLAAAYWPGPLTLVVPRSTDCPVAPLASAGLDSIAIRMPDHQLTAELIRRFGGPLVAPSANPSGRLSPSTAAHVTALLPEIDVLDGGACPVGLESSIVGCLEGTPLWLRAGGLARGDIAATLGMDLAEAPESETDTAKLAPGRLARHYAPQSALRLNALEATDKEIWLGFGPKAPTQCAANLSRAGDLHEAAANLFALLHSLDAQAQTDGKSLAVMPIPDDGLGEAINDRLQRAAAGANNNS